MDIKDILYDPAQQDKENSPPYRGTHMANFDDECVIYQNQRWYKYSLRYDLRTNTVLF